jgi:hypothetical protein
VTERWRPLTPSPWAQPSTDPADGTVSPLKRSRQDGATPPSTQVRFHRPKVAEGITITCPAPNSGTIRPWPGFNSDPMTEARHASASRTLRGSDVPSGPFHRRALALATRIWNSSSMIQKALLCLPNEASRRSYHSPPPQQLEYDAEAAHQHTHQQQPNRHPSNDSSINPHSRRVQTPHQTDRQTKNSELPQTYQPRQKPTTAPRPPQ